MDALQCAGNVALLDAISDPVFLLEPVWSPGEGLTDLVYRHVNAAAAVLYQCDPAEIVGHRQLELFPSVRDIGLLARYEQCLQTGVRDAVEIPTFDENGVAGAFMLHFAPVGDDLLVVARDITAQRRAEGELAEQLEHVRAILDHTRDCVSRYGPDLTFEYVNRRVEELSGMPAERWIGHSHRDLGYSETNADSWDARIRDVFATGQPTTFTYEVDNREGHTWWEASLAPEFGQGGAVAHVVSTNRDVTARVDAEHRLSELATHDPLTGLANRAALAAELSRALKARTRTDHSVAVLMLDLDRFKFVNDSRGHGAGDRLLCAVAQRIADEARGSDLVSRPGGDEFVIVMRDLASPGEAVTAAWRLVEAFRVPFHTPDGEFYATVSIGVALAMIGHTPEDVLRNADAAMYAAKDAGRDRVWVFNEDLRAAASARLKLEGELRHALGREELQVWYQPEVDLRSGRVDAAEALLRWVHPDGAVLTADRFVGLAEETGLILTIGTWVFRQVCDQAVTWARELARPIIIRVNLSALQLEDAGLLEAVDTAIQESGVDPRLLCIEITETVWLRGTEAVRVNLDGLHDRGISVAIDDFGTGYAALTYLRQYPVSVLKIDRSFVANIAVDDRDRRLVAGLIALAREVGVQVTAEGVESERQARVLRDLGCPTSQGFLYSRAVPAEQATLLLDVTFPHG